MTVFFSYITTDGAFYLWLVVMVLFGVVEAITLSLTSIWFTLGALPAMAAASLGAPMGVQIFLFLACSIVLLVYTRPLAMKKLRRERTNIDAIVGQEVIVTQEIDNDAPSGEVRIGGLLWSARTEDGSVINKGARVRVKRVQGVKVIVEALSGAKEQEERGAKTGAK